MALAALLLRMRTVPERSTDPDWQLALDRSVGCVRTVAERGSASLGYAVCAGLGQRPLAPLLGAWGKLSVGRVGLLDLATSARWPWLVLGALAPLFVFELVRRTRGTRRGLFAAAWLLALPGFTLCVARADTGALLGVSWLPAFAAYAAWLCARQQSARFRALLWVALATTCTVALLLGAGWALPLIALHYTLRGPAATRRLLRRGRLPLAGAALLGGLAYAVACVVFDPSLWHADLPKTIVTLFAQEGSADVRAGLHVAPWIWVAAALGLAALAWRALGRRFATGELRPERDRSASELLLLLGLLFGLALGGAPAAAPFLAAAAALGASTIAVTLVRERWQLALEFALLVLAAVS